MIVIIAEFDFPPEFRDRVLEIARGMDVGTSREAGCLHYRHAIDVSDENRLVLSEVWVDADALQAHFQTRHFRAFRGSATDLSVRAKIVQYVAEEVAGSDGCHWRALLEASGAPN